MARRSVKKSEKSWVWVCLCCVVDACDYEDSWYEAECQLEVSLQRAPMTPEQTDGGPAASTMNNEGDKYFTCHVGRHTRQS